MNNKPPKNYKPLPERTIQLQIRASDTGCFTWWDSEHMCPFLATSGFGTRLHCGLFDLVFEGSGYRQRKPEKTDKKGLPLGAQRCKECLAAEVLGVVQVANAIKPGDTVVATKGWREGCRTIRKGKRGVVKLVMQSEDGVVYRVRWEPYLQTDVVDPALIARATKTRR
jgi:hypothetical protein